MFDTTRRTLESCPVQSHKNEIALQEFLCQCLNQRVPGGCWKTGNSYRRSALVFGVGSVPDLVSTTAGPTIAIEVKYIRGRNASGRKGSGGVIWSGIGQAYANSLSHAHSILFIQSDVGETEQKREGQLMEFQREVRIPKEEFLDIAQQRWGITIIWRDANEAVF